MYARRRTNGARSVDVYASFSTPTNTKAGLARNTHRQRDKGRRHQYERLSGRVTKSHDDEQETFHFPKPCHRSVISPPLSGAPWAASTAAWSDANVVRRRTAAPRRHGEPGTNGESAGPRGFFARQTATLSRSSHNNDNGYEAATFWHADGGTLLPVSRARRKRRDVTTVSASL